MRLSTQLSRALANGTFRTEVYQSGYNLASAAGEDIWSTGGPYLGFLTSATAVELLSSDAADDDGGTGLQTVKVQGLDENWDYAEETVTMNGVSASTATTTTFIRVHRITGVTAGSGGVNAGTVTCRVVSAGATIAVANIGHGRSLQAIYTVPNLCTAFLTRAHMRSDGATGTDGGVLVRSGADGATPCITAVSYHTALNENNNLVESNCAIEIPARSDVWVRTLVGTAEPVDASLSLTVVGQAGSVQFARIR